MSSKKLDITEAEISLFQKHIELIKACGEYEAAVKQHEIAQKKYFDLKTSLGKDLVFDPTKAEEQ